MSQAYGPQVADAGELGLAQEQLRRLQAARASGGPSAGMAAELALWREHLAARQDTKLGTALPASSICAAGMQYLSLLGCFLHCIEGSHTANHRGSTLACTCSVEEGALGAFLYG